MIDFSWKFQRSFEQDNPQIYPLVIIDPDDNPIRISTIGTTVDGDFYLPVLENIKSLRESVDVGNYKLKLYSISLFINDREYNGEKFSSSGFNLGALSNLKFQEILQNRKVHVYYTSEGLTLAESPQIFSGTCVNFTQQELIIQLVLESSIKSKINLTIPTELIPHQESLLPQYQGKYWPFGTFTGYKQESELFFYNRMITEEGGFNIGPYVLDDWDPFGSPLVNDSSFFQPALQSYYALEEMQYMEWFVLLDNGFRSHANFSKYPPFTIIDGKKFYIPPGGGGGDSGLWYQEVDTIFEISYIRLGLFLQQQWDIDNGPGYEVTNLSNMLFTNYQNYSYISLTTLDGINAFSINPDLMVKTSVVQQRESFGDQGAIVPINPLAKGWVPTINYNRVITFNESTFDIPYEKITKASVMTHIYGTAGEDMSEMFIYSAVFTSGFDAGAFTYGPGFVFNAIWEFLPAFGSGADWAFDESTSPLAWDGLKHSGNDDDYFWVDEDDNVDGEIGIDNASIAHRKGMLFYPKILENKTETNHIGMDFKVKVSIMGIDAVGCTFDEVGEGAKIDIYVGYKKRGTELYTADVGWMGIRGFDGLSSPEENRAGTILHNVTDFTQISTSNPLVFEFDTKKLEYPETGDPAWADGKGIPIIVKGSDMSEEDDVHGWGWAAEEDSIEGWDAVGTLNFLVHVEFSDIVYETYQRVPFNNAKWFVENRSSYADAVYGWYGGELQTGYDEGQIPIAEGEEIETPFDFFDPDFDNPIDPGESQNILHPLFDMPATNVSDQVKRLAEKIGIDQLVFPENIQTLSDNVDWLDPLGVDMAYYNYGVPSISDYTTRASFVLYEPTNVLGFLDQLSYLYKFSLSSAGKWSGQGESWLTANAFRKTYFEEFHQYTEETAAGYTYLIAEGVYPQIDKNKIDKIIDIADINSFEYDRTDVSELYTRIQVPYGWSESLQKFRGYVEVSVNDVDGPYTVWDPGEPVDKIDNTAYAYQYYSLIKEDDDRGYEIDEESTTFRMPDVYAKLIPYEHTEPGYDQDAQARKIANIWLNYHCNLHLILKLELPISYLGIQAGDSISMSGLYHGIKPYNIDYAAKYTQYGEHTYAASMVNGQQAFNAFLVTKVSKNLDSIKIECVMAHDLDGGIFGFANIVKVCPSPGAINYQEVLPWEYNPDEPVEPYIIVYDESACIWPARYTGLYGGACNRIEHYGNDIIDAGVYDVIGSNLDQKRAEYQSMWPNLYAGMSVPNYSIHNDPGYSYNFSEMCTVNNADRKVWLGNGVVNEFIQQDTEHTFVNCEMSSGAFGGMTYVDSVSGIPGSNPNMWFRIAQDALWSSTSMTQFEGMYEIFPGNPRVFIEEHSQGTFLKLDTEGDLSHKVATLENMRAWYFDDELNPDREVPIIASLTNCQIEGPEGPVFFPGGTVSSAAITTDLSFQLKPGGGANVVLPPHDPNFIVPEEGIESQYDQNPTDMSVDQYTNWADTYNQWGKKWDFNNPLRRNNMIYGTYKMPWVNDLSAGDSLGVPIRLLARVGDPEKLLNYDILDLTIDDAGFWNTMTEYIDTVVQFNVLQYSASENKWYVIESNHPELHSNQTNWPTGWDPVVRQFESPGFLLIGIGGGSGAVEFNEFAGEYTNYSLDMNLHPKGVRTFSEFKEYWDPVMLSSAYETLAGLPEMNHWGGYLAADDYLLKIDVVWQPGGVEHTQYSQFSGKPESQLGSITGYHSWPVSLTLSNLTALQPYVTSQYNSTYLDYLSSMGFDLPGPDADFPYQIPDGGEGWFMFTPGNSITGEEGSPYSNFQWGPWLGTNYESIYYTEEDYLNHLKFFDQAWQRPDFSHPLWPIWWDVANALGSPSTALPLSGNPEWDQASLNLQGDGTLSAEDLHRAETMGELGWPGFLIPGLEKMKKPFSPL